MNHAYGVLGAAVALLLLFYLNAFVILLGGAQRRDYSSLKKRTGQGWLPKGLQRSATHSTRDRILNALDDYLSPSEA